MVTMRMHYKLGPAGQTLVSGDVRWPFIIPFSIKCRTRREITCLGSRRTNSTSSSCWGRKPVILIEINKAAFRLTSVHEGHSRKESADIPSMLGYPQRCRALEREHYRDRYHSLVSWLWAMLRMFLRFHFHWGRKSEKSTHAHSWEHRGEYLS